MKQLSGSFATEILKALRTDRSPRVIYSRNNLEQATWTGEKLQYGGMELNYSEIRRAAMRWTNSGISFHHKVGQHKKPDDFEDSDELIKI
jgi:hypothetical protein